MTTEENSTPEEEAVDKENKSSEPQKIWVADPLPSANGGVLDENPRVGSSFGTIEDEPLEQAESFDSLLIGEAPAPTIPEKRKSSWKTPVFSVLGVLMVAAIGFFGLMAYDNHQANLEAQRQEAQKVKEEKAKADAIRKADNPFAVLIGPVDPASETPFAAEVKDNKLNAGAATLTVKNGTLTPTVNGCTVAVVTDMCLAARGKFGESDFDVLLVKDISRNRFLQDPKDFKEIEMQGSTIAASMAIDIAGVEKPSNVGALTASGTTGFVLIFPEGTSIAKVEEVLKSSTVI